MRQDSLFATLVLSIALLVAAGLMNACACDVPQLDQDEISVVEDSLPPVGVASPLLGLVAPTLSSLDLYVPRGYPFVSEVFRPPAGSAS